MGDPGCENENSWSVVTKEEEETLRGLLIALVGGIAVTAIVMVIDILSK